MAWPWRYVRRNVWVWAVYFLQKGGYKSLFYAFEIPGYVPGNLPRSGADVYITFGSRNFDNIQ